VQLLHVQIQYYLIHTSVTTSNFSCMVVKLHLIESSALFEFRICVHMAHYVLQVVPILKTLYHAPDSNSHHIYMSLIILLILSEDDLFNKTVHETASYFI
jgi:hypothetical protein